MGHITGELEELSTCSKIEQVAADEAGNIKWQIDKPNLPYWYIKYILNSL